MQAPSFPNVAVVGMHFRGEHAKAWAESVQPGTEIFYEREPDNAYDSLAIRILYNFQHVGYVERGQAAFIAPWIDDGVEFSCVVTHTEQRGKNLHPIVTFTPVQSATADEEASVGVTV